MLEDGPAVDDALYSLAMGPDTRVRHYESCIVGDVRYNTLACDEGRKTCHHEHGYVQQRDN